MSVIKPFWTEHEKREKNEETLIEYLIKNLESCVLPKAKKPSCNLQFLKIVVLYIQNTAHLGD